MSKSNLQGANPSGAVQAYAGTTAPTGWLICDGSAISRTAYPILFSVLGITHGQGDGSTTFNIPDYRGKFLRAVDAGTGNDPDAATRGAMATGGNTGNNVGSIQGHDIVGHSHVTGLRSDGGTSFSSSTSATGVAGAAQGGGAVLNTFNTGGNETRPVNAYVNYIIKV